MSVVVGAPGTWYICPVHGRFQPVDPPRYEEGKPEAKCHAWLDGPPLYGRTYCGRFAPAEAVAS